MGVGLSIFCFLMIIIAVTKNKQKKWDQYFFRTTLLYINRTIFQNMSVKHNWLKVIVFS